MNENAKIAYSIPEALEASGLGRTTLYKLIKEGRLEARKIGSRTVILRSSLVDLINNAPAVAA